MAIPLDSIYTKIIEDGLQLSPTQGNGYGLALGFSLFINAVLVCAIVWLVRENKRNAKEYVSYLKRAKIANGGGKRESA